MKTMFLHHSGLQYREQPSKRGSTKRGCNQRVCAIDMLSGCIRPEWIAAAAGLSYLTRCLSPTSDVPQSHTSSCCPTRAPYLLSPTLSRLQRSTTMEIDKEKVQSLGGPRLPPISCFFPIPIPFFPPRSGSVAIFLTLVSWKDRTAFVARSSSDTKATLGALGCFHSQRDPLSFHMSLI